MYFAFTPASIVRLSGVLSLALLTACGGGGGGGSSSDPAPTPDTGQPAGEPPQNPISQAYFRDTDGTLGQISGTVQLTLNAEQAETGITRIQVFWASGQGQAQGDAWLVTEGNAPFEVNIPQGTELPQNQSGLLLIPGNDQHSSEQATWVRFHDFTGNAELNGPGGNEQQNWTYGTDRPGIAIRRSNEQGGLCSLDNGLVQVTDMQNQRDTVWEADSSNANVANDAAFPAYQFLCDPNPVNTERPILHNNNDVYTYSTLNDAMHYGTLAYDAYLKYLGEPPLEDKIRLRVHYGQDIATDAFWDGAYANFSDAYGVAYTFATLDIIAHEVAHGILIRISNLADFETELSQDARTLSEAFSDISGVMVKYHVTNTPDDWIHGQESAGPVRHLNQIITEDNAIDSFLDYDDAENNPYKRIGMITYPFYLLANQWGLENAYQVILDSVRHCWQANTDLPQAAECIRTSAETLGQPSQDVVDAFRQVKIRLDQQDALSHFEYQKFKLTSHFTDTSLSDSNITAWTWDFGDGNTANIQHPQHTYATAGDYQVSLSVTAGNGRTDQISRTVSVTDQYCAIRANNNGENQIGQVIIDGQDLGFDANEPDYTDTIITVADASDVPIQIQGTPNATARTTRWMIWLDLNDDGIFGDTPEEIIASIDNAEGEAYQLITSLDLSQYQNNDEQAKYMRIAGEYALQNPCTSLNAGEALDVRINW